MDRRLPSKIEWLKHLLDRGEIAVGIYIPPDFERRLADDGRPAAQLLVDGSDPVIEGIARGLVALLGPDRFAVREAPSRSSKCAPITTPSGAPRCRSCRA